MGQKSMSTNYQVVIKGLASGQSKEIVAGKLASLLNISSDEVGQMLLEPNLVVKKGVDFQAAVKYVEVLENCGCSCEVRPIANVELTPLPSYVTTPPAPPLPSSPFSSTPSAPASFSAHPTFSSHPTPPLPTTPKERDSVAEIESPRNGLKPTLIVTVVLGLLAFGGGGYFVWESKKQSEAVEKARVEQDAKLQIERAALALREVEAIARQESLKLASIEKEDAIRIANEEAAVKEAETSAADEQTTLQLERDAVQQTPQNASREQVIKDQNNAIQRMLTNARACLTRLNYSCVITNADNVLSFEPGNTLAQDFKRTAEDAQNKATENIRID